MPGQTANVAKTVKIGQTQLTQNLSVSLESSINIVAASAPGGKTGTLTTRTDNDTGTLTMVSGHGLTTGDKVDIFWAGGSRYNVTVGTVSGNSVPIDVGSGTNLPSTSTAVVVCKPQQFSCQVDGDLVVAVGFGSTNKIIVTFFDASNAVLLSKEVVAGQIWSWDENTVDTNPFAGMAVSYVKLSNGGTAAADIKLAFGLHS